VAVPVTLIGVMAFGVFLMTATHYFDASNRVPEVAGSTLLSGGIFALEQCGRLLEDAVILFEHSRHATAAGVALLAREEMGRHRILLDLWRRGQPVTVAEIKAACEDHERKQASGAGSLTYRTDRDSELGKLLQARHEHSPGTPEYQRTDAALAALDKQKERRQPHDRHEQRMRAFYVDFSAEGVSWLRPCELSPKACAEIVTDAINDYTLARERIEQAAPLYDDHALAAAIAALPERADLPPPRHIPFEIVAPFL
jgi:AbiV family abortive infection protein